MSHQLNKSRRRANHYRFFQSIMQTSASPSVPSQSPGPTIANKVVLEARKKFASALDDEVLDYRHNHPVHVENCVNTLIKIFDNVVQSHDQEKFRQVKATSNTFKNNVANVKGGEHLMQLAGWTTQVVDLQKYWVFEAGPESLKFSILSEAVTVLQKAQRHIHEKAERARKQVGDKKAEDAELREKVRLQIEDDKADRKLKAEVMGAVAPLQKGSDT